MILVVSCDNELKNDVSAILSIERTVREADNSSIFTVLKSADFNILILDGDLMQGDMSFLRKIRFDFPELRVIVIAAPDRFQMQVKSLRYGVMDVVQRHTFAADLSFVVDRVIQSPVRALPKGQAAESSAWIEQVLDNLTYENVFKDWSELGTYLKGMPDSSFQREVMNYYGDVSRANEPVFRICLVEDEVDLVSVLRRLFEREGCEVMVCGTVAETMGYLATHPVIDLMVLDLGLPDGTGDAILKQADTFGVLVLTAYEDVEMAVQSVHAGALGYLTKPFNNRDLVLEAKRLILDRCLAGVFEASFC